VVAVFGAGQGEAQAWDLHGLSLMMLATGCWIEECLAIGWGEIDLYEVTVDVYPRTGAPGTARRRARLYHR
jgi:hypothetical protein